MAAKKTLQRSASFQEQAKSKWEVAIDSIMLRSNSLERSSAICDINEIISRRKMGIDVDPILWITSFSMSCPTTSLTSNGRYSRTSRVQYLSMSAQWVQYVLGLVFLARFMSWFVVNDPTALAWLGDFTHFFPGDPVYFRLLILVVMLLSFNYRTALVVSHLASKRGNYKTLEWLGVFRYVSKSYWSASGAGGPGGPFEEVFMTRSDLYHFALHAKFVLTTLCSILGGYIVMVYIFCAASYFLLYPPDLQWTAGLLNYAVVLIWVPNLIPTYFSVTFIFYVLCSYMRIAFMRLNLQMKYMQIKSSAEPDHMISSGRLMQWIVRHNAAIKLVARCNYTWKRHIAVTFLLLSSITVLIVFIFLFERENMLIVQFVVLVVGAVYYVAALIGMALSAGMVLTAANESYEQLNSLFVRHLNHIGLLERMKLSSYIQRYHSDSCSVGFTCADLFPVKQSTVAKLIVGLVSLFMLLIRLKEK